MTSDERTAQLLGALALALADGTGAAVEAQAGVSGSDAAALVTLRNYAEGEPLGLLRRALALSHPGIVRVADRLQAGTVWINEAAYINPLAAFAGHKQSGLGTENGLEGLLEYTQAQTRVLRKPAVV